SATNGSHRVFESLVFIIVVMMFAERGPTKSRHDFAKEQIKKDNSAYSSTRQITTERKIRRRTDLEELPDVRSSRPEEGSARTRSTPNRCRTVEFDEWVHASENCS